MRLGMGLRLSDILKHGAAGYTGTLLDGMVSYWPLDEESGTRYDAVGDNDLTDNNTVGFDTGVNGAAASFVFANNEFLSRDFDASLNLTGEVTYSCWFKPSGSDNFQNLMGFDYSDAIPAFMLWCNVTVPQFAYAASGSDWVRLNPGVAVTTNEWHHFVAWFDPADKKGRMQIDGGVVSEGAALTGSALRSSSTEVWKIGKWSFGQFDGQIDEPAIWSRVLTADERTELYNSGSGFFYPFT